MKLEQEWVNPGVMEALFQEKLDFATVYQIMFL